MGFIDELVKYLESFTPFGIVDEWERAIYVGRGLVRERHRKLTLDDKLAMEAEEKAKVKEMGGYMQFLPFRRLQIPEGYRRSKVTGRLLSDKRYSKVLEPGWYWLIPR